MRYLLLTLIFLIGCDEKKFEKREFPISETVSPCDNFYKYACEEVTKNFELRADRSRHAFAFTDSYDRILEFKKYFFNNMDDYDLKTKKELMLKNYYLSCMDKESRAKEEQSFVAKQKAMLEAITTKKEMLELLKKNVSTPHFSFIKFGDITNQDNPEIYDVYRSIQVMNLPEKTYYEDEKIIADYTNLTEDFYQTIGVDNAKERAKRFIQFEKDFAKDFITRKQMRDRFSEKNRESRASILKNQSNLGYAKRLDLLPRKTKVRNVWPEGLKFLDAYVKKASLNELKDLYLFYTLYPLLDDGYPEFYNKRFAFNHKHFGGPEVRTERQERCTQKVMGTLGKELDYTLMDRMFPSFDKDKFVKLLEKVRSALLLQLENNTWLSPKTKKEAIKKIKLAKFQVVKPDRLEDWDFNPEVEFSKGTYIANNLKLDQAVQDKMFKELSEKINPNIWSMSPLTVNAYYHPAFNKFVMPLGILQYPFYEQDLPDHINLGAVGVVVGHELGHGVDDKGAKYDYQGRLRNWFTKEDFKKFSERSNRLVDLWELAGEDGAFKLGENIGDLVGVTSGYLAAFGPESNTQNLSSEELNKQKREFFTQYARAWCQVIRPKLAEKFLKTDPHSSGTLRVNGQVVHQDGFYEAFSCKKDDPMYLAPEKRVRIW